VLEWYVEHALLVNGLLVAVALLSLAFPRQRNRISATLRKAWRKTPLALPEEDRRLVDEYMGKRRTALYGEPRDRENNESS